MADRLRTQYNIGEKITSAHVHADLNADTTVKL